MKNKLFYGLFLVYAVMVVFILYINGVFSGTVTSNQNLIINGVFLIVIGVLFLISAVGFIRLNRLTDDLQDASIELQKEYKEAGGKNLWFALQDNKNFFQDENLKVAFAKYRHRVKSGRVSKGFVNTCDIEEYINEELLETVGKSYFNSGISGTLTGLGILGTFIGLSLGLGAFNGDDIYTISDNVGPLLSGMKVAFHTSVYGIFFSLIFNFVYRGIMADAYEKLNAFINTFKHCALPPTAGSGDDNMAAMLVYQANQANYMKQLLELAKGEAKEQNLALDKMTTQFMNRLQATMGSEFAALGDSIKTGALMQQTGAETTEKLIKATADLVEANRSTQEMMRQLMTRQEQMAQEIAEQKKKLEETCDEMSRDISNQLYTFEQMRNMYEK